MYDSDPAGAGVGSIRCIAIGDTEEHSGPTLFPLAMAVIQCGTEPIEKLMQDPAREWFTDCVNDKCSDILEHLREENPNAGPDEIEHEARCTPPPAS